MRRPAANPERDAGLAGSFEEKEKEDGMPLGVREPQLTPQAKSYLIARRADRAGQAAGRRP